MKTNQNNQVTPSEIPPQSGQAISDSNLLKKYEVELHYTQYNYARVIVEAASPEEAEEKAEAAEIEKWTKADGDLYVYSVEPVTEGQSHD